MSVSLSPSTATVLRGQQFDLNISAQSEDTVTSVSAVLNGTEPQVQIQNHTTSVNISGRYENAWADQFTFVSAGESNLTETPQTVTYFENLPPEQNLFNLDQDLSDTKTRTYTVTVKYRDANTNQERTTTLNFTHIIEQDWEAVMQLMANYKYNATGEF